MARTIHSLSTRQNGPFIAVNCAALPDTLLESELFGYKAGAFTGALKDKPGRFALAKTGTLFLDEIGEISAALQVRLLRVLQDQIYEPLGATRSETADARIIVATNKDLAEQMRLGLFREDLYYRVNVVRIALPPLRSRKEDIPLLVEQFIDLFNRMQKKSVPGISAEALSLLMAHDWPGNVRELKNVIEWAFILCRESHIGIGHLPEELTSRNLKTVMSSNMRGSRDLFDSQTITEALANNNFNRLAAAKALGIHKTTLFRKIKKLGISLPKEDGRSHRRRNQ
jgi:transcriptional regulator with PAS, ATPase and Fis domain